MCPMPRALVSVIRNRVSGPARSTVYGCPSSLLNEPAGGTTIAVLENLAAAGRFAPEDTVVALITGNGLKTLDEHPAKEWPAKIDCELQSMLEALSELKSTPTLMQTAHEQLRA